MGAVEDGESAANREIDRAGPKRTWRKDVLVAALGGLVLGVLACAVEWKPDARVTLTGFPFPIGIMVVRPDGSVDAGVGLEGYVLNPLTFGAALLAILLVVRGLRRASGR